MEGMAGFDARMMEHDSPSPGKPTAGTRSIHGMDKLSSGKIFLDLLDRQTKFTPVRSLDRSIIRVDPVRLGVTGSSDRVREKGRV